MVAGPVLHLWEAEQVSQGLKVTDKHRIKVHEPEKLAGVWVKPKEEEAPLLVLLVHVPHGGLGVGQGGLVHHLHHVAHLGRSVDANGEWSDGTHHRKTNARTWQFEPFPVCDVVVGEPEEEEGHQQGDHHPWQLWVSGDCYGSC